MTNDGTPVIRGDGVLHRLPSKIRAPITWVATQWPGRIILGTAGGMARIEIFDRSMTIAAQFFTSLFPIVIMAASWLDTSAFERLAGSLDVPPQTRSVLNEAISETSVDAFGLVGTLVVLISATSLSRALTRAFSAVWTLERNPRRMVDVWRWLAVILALAVAMFLTRLAVNLVQELPPRQLWSAAVHFTIYGLIAVLVPWLLMAGRVSLRRLVPGGIAFAGLMLVVQPASTVYLSLALQTSAERYGSIGLAFTYLTWLYVISFTLLASAVIGQVLVSDYGKLGRYLRSG